MTKNESKMGFKVFENRKGTICINPDAYNSLAADMKAECSILPLDRLGVWFDKWLKKSGYTMDDFSVCFTKSSLSASGAFDTTIYFTSSRVNCVSIAYEGVKSFTIKTGVIGFLLIPDLSPRLLPKFLRDSLFDIKNMVLSSANRLSSYSIKFSTYISGEPFSSVRYCSDLLTSGDLVGSLLYLCDAGFQSVILECLDEGDPDRATIYRYLTTLKSCF